MHSRLIHFCAIVLTTLSLIGSGGMVHAAASYVDEGHIAVVQHTAAVDAQLGCHSDIAHDLTAMDHDTHAAGSMCCEAVCSAAGIPHRGFSATSFQTLKVLRQTVLYDLDAPSFSGNPLRRPPKA
jgi:hypothetical protein